MPLRAKVVDDIEDRELAFKFTNGSVALDLVATVGERWNRRFERLRSTDDLARWLVESGLVDQRLEVQEQDLRQARDLRSAIFDIVQSRRSGADVPKAAQRVINDLAAAPPAHPHLGRGWRARSVAAGVAAAWSMVARDAIDLVTTVPPDRLRECAADDCSRLFVDRSRPGARRWCESEGCGNRAKIAAFRARQRPRPPRRATRNR